jgi:D-alanine transaminase
MSKIAYVNGTYLPLSRAAIHVEDRGFQFADGVYEVVYLHQGRPVDVVLHLDRLERSLRELRLPAPMGRLALMAVIAELARRNRLRTGLVYIQVTRGAAPRNHVFPAPATRPTIVVTLRRAAHFPENLEDWTGTAITMPDQRWARCDIKSVALLPNVLAKQAAREAGAVEAILFDHAGMITEGASTSVWIVDQHGVLRTRKLGHEILPGCTRAALLTELEVAGTALEQRAVSRAELHAAREVFLTAATSFVKPILSLDGVPVGDGQIGPVARHLFALLSRHITGDPVPPAVAAPPPVHPWRAESEQPEAAIGLPPDRQG